MSTINHDELIFKSDLLSVMNYRCDGRDTRGEESSTQAEIILPRAGAYQRRDAYGTFLADPNQVLFFNQGESYKITHPIQGGDASTIFSFVPSLLIEILRIHNPDVENRPHRLFHHSHISLDARLQILQYRLLNAKKNENWEPLEIEERCVMLLGEVIRALFEQRPVRKRRSSAHTLRAYMDQTHAIQLFLNSHVHSRLGLEQISSAVHLSPYHLCRVFKQTTGMTLHRYMKRLRLFNMAERMLEDPRARLDIIAGDFRFSSHAHFSADFRKMFGVSPSEFRAARFRQMSKNLIA